MLTKKQLKLYTSLHKKKYRLEHGLFLAEGDKIVRDLLCSDIKSEAILCSSEILQVISFPNNAINIIECDSSEIKKISSLSTPTEVIGIFSIPEKNIDKSKIKENLSLVLDDIQDPGNMGTIIRIADWFGINNIFCSKGCVDVYNPKTVQASMGAISKINVVYCNLDELISEYINEDFPVYGAFLEGDNIYSIDLKDRGFIVVGNEGQGISQKISSLVSQKINIPPYSVSETASESLNVAVATSIICSEFRKNSIKKR